LLEALFTVNMYISEGPNPGKECPYTRYENSSAKTPIFDKLKISKNRTGFPLFLSSFWTRKLTSIPETPQSRIIKSTWLTQIGIGREACEMATSEHPTHHINWHLCMAHRHGKIVGDRARTGQPPAGAFWWVYYTIPRWVPCKVSILFTARSKCPLLY